MTRKLYYENSHLSTFEAQVISCELQGDFYQLVLDATAFFPEGGGQAADTGALTASDGTVIQILDVKKKVM